MNLPEQFLWLIYPYLVIAIFVMGLLYRYNKDQRGWSAKSSQLLEKQLLKWGSILFHTGIILAFFGHIAGLLVPLWVYNVLLGVSEEQYKVTAALMGGMAGILSTVGLGILLYRRFFVKRIRITSSTADIISVVLLGIVVLNGTLVTFYHSIDRSGYDYRANLGPWLRSVLIFSPDAALMSQVPFIFKFHVFTAFAFFAIMPFSRMVHILSQPVTYLFRSYVVYRKRA